MATPKTGGVRPFISDPVIAAYRKWLAAYYANDAFLATGRDDNHPEGKVLYDRVCSARLALSDAGATTPAGLVLQIQFAFAVFGEVDHDDDWFDLDKYKFHGWSEDHEGRLLRSMLTGAEGMAS